MPKPGKRPAKLANLMAKIHECLDAGRVLDSRHAAARLDLRRVTGLEAVQALRNGHPVPSRDRWQDAYQAWSYAIEGKTLALRKLRVVVSFEESSGMLIITVIDLDL